MRNKSKNERTCTLVLELQRQTNGEIRSLQTALLVTNVQPLIQAVRTLAGSKTGLIRQEYCKSNEMSVHFFTMVLVYQSPPLH